MVDMNALVRLESITFKDGTSVNVADADVIVLVGPNGSGKSRTLMDLATSAAGNRELVVLDRASWTKGTTTELEEWLIENRTVTIGLDGSRSLIAKNQGLRLDQSLALWQLPNTSGLQPFSDALVQDMWGSERLNMLSQGTRFSLSRPTPQNAADHVLRDQVKLDRFRKALRRAFGFNLIINGWADSQVELLISKSLTQEDFLTSSVDGIPTPDLLRRFGELRSIFTESDGVRTFAGILMALLGQSHPIMLIDEPETFLHPPAAKEVGRAFAQRYATSQAIIATHSLDVLLGLLDVPSAKVCVIRLTRPDEVTSPRVLEPHNVRKLWQDPILRYSRAFDGLFHDGVVICEGDADAQFYNAVASYLNDQQRTDLEDSRPKQLDLMYCYTGGKQRMHVLAAALRAVGVPVRIIADFDVLNDDAVVQRLVHCLGGEYSGEWKDARSAIDGVIRGTAIERLIGEASTEILAILGQKPDHRLDKIKRQQIVKAIASQNGWEQAKRIGAEVVRGEERDTLDGLLYELRAVGLFVVTCGTVESFVPQVGLHGPAWVIDVAEQDRIPMAHEAQKFMRALLDSLT